MAEEHAKLRRQLIGDKGLVDENTKDDEKALAKYLDSKQAEEERRVRYIKS